MLSAGTIYSDFSSRLNITEQDGTPSTYPYKLKVTNGSLTDNGDGTASLSTSGGGLPLPQGATNYIQNQANTTNNQPGATIDISSATIRGILDINRPDLTGFSGAYRLQLDPSSASGGLILSNHNNTATSNAMFFNDQTERQYGQIDMGMGVSSFSIRRSSCTLNIGTTCNPQIRWTGSPAGNQTFNDWLGNIVLTINNNGITLPSFNTTSTSVTVTGSGGLASPSLMLTSANRAMYYTDGTPTLSMPDSFTTYFGYNSGLTPTLGGSFNTCFGSGCMQNLSTGFFNTGLGYGVLAGVVTGIQNDCIGYAACGTNTDGGNNNAMGGSTLLLNQHGSNNTAVGSLALNMDTVDNNTAIGYQSSQFVTTGVGNVSIGYQAGVGTGTTNTGNVLGAQNTYVGFQTGQGISSATIINNSIAIGYRALVVSSNTAQIGGTWGSGNEVVMNVASITVNQFTAYGHMITTGTAPGISSCGATPSGSVVGDDNQGIVTIGGGIVTSCVLTFNQTWGITPVCNVTDNSTSVNPSVTSQSATAITIGLSATLGGGIVNYRCGCSGVGCK